jgi:hypothetical protein
MKRVIVRYTVKPGLAEANEELVRAVYDELEQRQPEGLRYATFRLDDGLSFVHIAQVDGEANPLTELPAFRAFVEGIGERCEQPPVTSGLSEIGSFRLFSSIEEGAS